MGGWTRKAIRSGAVATATLGLLSCVGANAPGFPSAYHWFESPREADPWRKPILDWQHRVRARQGGSSAGAQQTAVSASRPSTRPAGTETAALADAYHAFQQRERKRLVREVSTWIQEQAKQHFVPDPGVDIWPTPEEVLATGGDDCDGLAFLTHRLLLEMGLSEDELFLAIVRRERDGLHHMVGLWFGDGEDPWIVDPTGAMTTEFVRMSSVGGWKPLAVFTETAHYRALPNVASAPR